MQFLILQVLECPKSVRNSLFYEYLCLSPLLFYSLGFLLSTIGLYVWFGFRTASINQIVFPLQTQEAYLKGFSRLEWMENKARIVHTCFVPIEPIKSLTRQIGPENYMQHTQLKKKKSRIRETLNLSMCGDSSTNTNTSQKIQNFVPLLD